MLRTTIVVAALLASAGGASAQGDVALGEAKFAERCASCHSIGGEGGTNAPALDNVVGRPAAALPGFNYSDGMVEAAQGGVVWDLETLSKFLTKPRTVVNGSTMGFTGFPNPDDVANVVAYLATFSPSAQ